MPEMTEERVREIARDEVTRFFNHYLLNIFPKQMDRILKAHNHDTTAHNGVVRLFERQRWMLVGLVAGLAFTGGAGFVKLINLI